MNSQFRTLLNLSGESDHAESIRYALSRMKRLEAYLGDGKLSIDNDAYTSETVAAPAEV